MLESDMKLIEEAKECSTMEINPVYGELRIDTDKHKVFINGNEVTIATYIEDQWFYETFNQ